MNWKVKIGGIKQLLSDDTSNKEAKRVGSIIYKIISSKTYTKYFEDFSYETGTDIEEFSEIIDCKDLNGLLNDLYNYCDTNRILIG